MSKFRTNKLRELISADKINSRIQQMGQEITKYYQDIINDQSPLVLIGVLKGSIIFLADISRAIDLPIELEMMGVSSYGEATESSGEVRITQDLTRPIKNKHILIVEDIIDTGLTLKYLLDNLQAREPASIQVCSFLEKPENNQSNVKLDFIGFQIPNEFVVGYGLDVAEKYRNLPMVAVYEG